MTGLFRPHYSFLQTNAWQRQAQNALRYNTSQVGAVIPMIYGTVRQQMNLLAFGGYRGPGGGKKGKGIGPLPIGGASNTAKGGGGGKKGGKKAPPDFSIDVDMGVCEGPVTVNSYSKIWASGEVAQWSGGLGLHFYNGANGQAPDPTAESMGATIGYSGTCHVTGTPIDLGPSPVLPNLGFEIVGYLAGTIGPDDAEPGQVITHFLTDPQRGALFPSEFIDTDAIGSFTQYCTQANLGISIALDGQQTGLEWLGGMLKTLSSTMVWSGDRLKIIPFADNPVGSWSPDFTVAYDINEDSLIRENHLGDVLLDAGDPILLTRVPPTDIPNWVSMEYLDRNNNYNSTIMSQFDQSSINSYGLRIGDNLQGRMFADQNAADFASRTIIQRLQYIRNTVKVKIGWQYSCLEPMDIITISGGQPASKYVDIVDGSQFRQNNADIYLDHQPFRILSIEEDDNGDLMLEAEMVPTGDIHPTHGAQPWDQSTPIRFWYGGDCTVDWDFNRVPGTLYPGSSYLAESFVAPECDNPPLGCMSIWIKPNRQGMVLSHVPPGFSNSSPNPVRGAPAYPRGLGFYDDRIPINQDYKPYYYSSIFSYGSSGGSIYWRGAYRHGGTLEYGTADGMPVQPFPPPGAYTFLHPEAPIIHLGFDCSGAFFVRYSSYANPTSVDYGIPYSFFFGRPLPPYYGPWFLESSVLLGSKPERVQWNRWQHLYLIWDGPHPKNTKLYLGGAPVTLSDMSYGLDNITGYPYNRGNGAIFTETSWSSGSTGGWQCCPNSLYYALGMSGCATDYWFSHDHSLGGNGWKNFFNKSTGKAVWDLGEFGEKPLGGIRPDVFHRNYNGTTGVATYLPPGVFYPDYEGWENDIRTFAGAGLNQVKKDTDPYLIRYWPGGGGFAGYGIPVGASIDNPWGL